MPYTDEFEKTFRVNDKTFVLRMRPTGNLLGPRPQVAYSFSEEGSREPIFAGDDFYPGRPEIGYPAKPMLGDEAARVLMGFLLLQPGETDTDYFVNHTDDQMQFVVSEYADELRGQIVVEDYAARKKRGEIQ